MQYKHVFWCPFRHPSVKSVFFVPFFFFLHSFPQIPQSQKKVKRNCTFMSHPKNTRSRHCSFLDVKTFKRSLHCKDLPLVCECVPEPVLPGPFPRTTVLRVGHIEPSINRRRVCRLRVLGEIYIDRKTFVFRLHCFPFLN